MLQIYNTLSRSVEAFEPINPPHVGVYSCGPTVYDYAHIGHMRKYTMDDILVRVLRADGYIVKHVMNITDVGHLVSDEDSGEDKMEKGAKKYGMNVWEIAKKFEEQFFASTDGMNIKRPDEVMHATGYIREQIALVKELEQKGYTYEISGDGLYFDTSKFPDYFQLSRQNPDALKKGARVDFVEGKKNAADFALWKFSPKDASLPRRAMEWWFKGPYEGRLVNIDQLTDAEEDLKEFEDTIGFPGWHIECSAMSMKALGPHFDIHTGGIDHITIHHTDEIAQSECATGEKFVNYWVHHNWLLVNGEKMSKSLGNFYTLQDLTEKGYDPMALRYLFLQTHYRQEMNFTFESLDAASVALSKLRGHVGDEPELAPNISWMGKFMDALNDDLGTAKALAVVWEMVKDENLMPGEKKGTLLAMDEILGLRLDLGFKSQDLRKEDLPQAVQDLLKEREAFRKAGDWAASDELRQKIQDLGYTIKDTKDGPEVTKA